MILVFGETGQLARELAGQGETFCFGRAQADFSEPDSCARQVMETDCAAVIIAAAYTAVDRAEEEERLATVINAETPGAIARACAARDLPLVHVSTDYVFDGSGTAPRRPSDPVAPLNAYGRSKLAGERAVAGAGGVHAILRTSWVVSAHGHNFVKTMLRLGAERDRLSVVGDQIGGLTPARDLARACQHVAAALCEDPGRAGTYHYAGAPDASWADVAREIFALAGLGCTVEEIASEAYPTPARRPVNSRLDCAATETVFGLKRPDWRVSLRTILNDLGVGLHG
jgi:dTDP-4-dehydrorhamnose reductase